MLLLAFYPHGEGDRVSLCGPVGEQPVVHHNIELSQAERLVDVALNEPSHHAATRFLLTALPELDSPFPGLRNVGLLATQELRAGVRRRSDWAAATRKSNHLLGLRGRNLVEKLGFSVTALATNASMLTINGKKHAIAVFCDDSEQFDTPTRRFDKTSPISQALALADRENVDWIILTRSSEIRLYSARLDAGVGRKGRSETFVELNLSLVPAELAGYLHLLFSADALAKGGSLSEIIEHSEVFASELAVRLRERVYHEAVPALSRAVANNLSREQLVELTEANLVDVYEQVMVILFRLLFVAYAEDESLLPYNSNGRYADNSLKRKAQHLANDQRQGKESYDSQATSLWDGVNQLWDAVDRGNSDWGIPTYNGGLFSRDPQVSASGAALTELSLTNAEFGPALASILIDEGPEGVGPIDFREISVRDFGTIYEGLLESKLSVAQSDLTVKRIKGKDQYHPAEERDEVVVARGAVYFHNRSGVRKATGSYFTKEFAVEHLLDHALEPALDDHIARLESLRELGDDAGIARAFFDFRCADIAMGSGHFLVAAVDRIEVRLSAWLTLHPVPAVTAELERLREVALQALRELGSEPELDTTTLLRRQVARHCVYGVDRNQVAVELARLAIWVHTFVPGLPLSLLDRNLVHGDSLTGVASLDEAAAALAPKGAETRGALLLSDLHDWLGASKEDLERLGRLNDASKAEVDAARTLDREARDKVEPVRSVFDVVTAVRAGAIDKPVGVDPESMAKLASDPLVRETIARLAPVHYPTTWPELFVRGDRDGFDCLLGNPPWEKVVVDREVWWGMHLPGVRSAPVAQRRARIDALESERPDLEAEFETEKQRAEDFKKVLRATFANLGSGQTDLYKAFAWANLGLCREGGKIGLVLPRSAVSDAGMANWRTRVVGEREREIQPRCGSQWRRSSITRAGCSRGFTTPTPSR